MARQQPGTVIDIGCAEGWFLRKAVEEFGCWGIGVDAKPERVLLRHALAGLRLRRQWFDARRWFSLNEFVREA